MNVYCKSLLTLLLSLLLTGCPFLLGSKENKDLKPGEGNLVLFIGVDISGSFKNSPHFRDSLRFAARYIYGHLHGIGGLKVPHSLFVGSIGGAKANESKTFFPIQNFQYKSIKEIEKELFEIFPASTTNKFTDFNAYFEQVATFMRNKELILKPTSIVLLTDGVPDSPDIDRKKRYKSLDLRPFENLSRKITVRVLYTSAETGMNWQTKVPRSRVRVWTQDANVMENWKSKDIMVPGKPFEKQERFFDWVQDNVDFHVRVRRVYR
jgi:hypothetical protein